MDGLDELLKRKISSGLVERPRPIKGGEVPRYFFEFFKSGIYDAKSMHVWFMISPCKLAGYGRALFMPPKAA